MLCISNQLILSLPHIRARGKRAVVATGAVVVATFNAGLWKINMDEDFGLNQAIQIRSCNRKVRSRAGARSGRPFCFGKTM